MSEPFLIALLLFLSNINEHFEESNDCTINSFVTYNIYIQIDNETIYLNRLYNDYGIKYKEPFYITNIRNITDIVNDYYNVKEKNWIYIINDSEDLENSINEIKDSFTIEDSLILLIDDRLVSKLNLNYTNIYKNVDNCFILTFEEYNTILKVRELKKEPEKIKKMIINVDLTYANYPLTVYIILITIFFVSICVLLFFFVKSYLKQDDIDKLNIHLVIIFCLGLLIICYILAFVEILLSEKCLIYKLISVGFLINKILKNIFFCITKNSIILLLILISRGYCILFFDRLNFKVARTSMIIILFFDYLWEIIIMQLQDIYKFNLMKDLYNILYYVFTEIIIYLNGKNITITLKFFSFIVQNNLIRARNEQELNNIKEVVNYKINKRKKVDVFNFIFFIISILISLLYIISIPIKGSTLYDILSLIQFSVFLILFAYNFYPKKLPQNYTMNFSDLIRGMHGEYITEYLFKFGDNNIIDKIDYDFNIKKEVPIIILNPYQILYNDNKNYIRKDENDEYESINDKIINSFLKKGQIGYLEVIE